MCYIKGIMCRTSSVHVSYLCYTRGSDCHHFQTKMSFFFSSPPRNLVRTDTIDGGSGTLTILAPGWNFDTKNTAFMSKYYT